MLRSSAQPGRQALAGARCRALGPAARIICVRSRMTPSAYSRSCYCSLEHCSDKTLTVGHFSLTISMRPVPPRHQRGMSLASRSHTLTDADKLGCGEHRHGTVTDALAALDHSVRPDVTNVPGGSPLITLHDVLLLSMQSADGSSTVLQKWQACARARAPPQLYCCHQSACVDTANLDPDAGG